MWAELQGAVGVITGGAGAIGSETAAVFAEHGVTVAIADIVDPSPVVARIDSAGGRALGVQADMNDLDAVDRMVRDVLEFSGGRSDLLINFAGLFNDVRRVPFW